MQLLTQFSAIDGLRTKTLDPAHNGSAKLAAFLRLYDLSNLRRPGFRSPFLVLQSTDVLRRSHLMLHDEFSFKRQDRTYYCWVARDMSAIIGFKDAHSPDFCFVPWPFRARQNPKVSGYFLHLDTTGGGMRYTYSGFDEGEGYIGKTDLLKVPHATDNIPADVRQIGQAYRFSLRSDIHRIVERFEAALLIGGRLSHIEKSIRDRTAIAWFDRNYRDVPSDAFNALFGDLHLWILAKYQPKQEHWLRFLPRKITPQGQVLGGSLCALHSSPWGGKDTPEDRVPETDEPLERICRYLLRAWDLVPLEEQISHRGDLDDTVFTSKSTRLGDVTAHQMIAAVARIDALFERLDGRPAAA